MFSESCLRASIDSEIGNEKGWRDVVGVALTGTACNCQHICACPARVDGLQYTGTVGCCLEARGLWAVLGRKQGCLLINSPSSPRTIMSTAPTAPSTSTSQCNFATIFNAALESYKRKTKKDLASHPLVPSLNSCESPEAVLTVFRDQVLASVNPRYAYFMYSNGDRVEDSQPIACALDGSAVHTCISRIVAHDIPDMPKQLFVRLPVYPKLSTPGPTSRLMMNTCAAISWRKALRSSQCTFVI
jgi:hypothetical protein